MPYRNEVLRFAVTIFLAAAVGNFPVFPRKLLFKLLESVLLLSFSFLLEIPGAAKNYFDFLADESRELGHTIKSPLFSRHLENL